MGSKLHKFSNNPLVLSMMDVYNKSLLEISVIVIVVGVCLCYHETGHAVVVKGRVCPC